jgi:hypothetical protein
LAEKPKSHAEKHHRRREQQLAEQGRISQQALAAESGVSLANQWYHGLLCVGREPIPEPSGGARSSPMIAYAVGLAQASILQSLPKDRAPSKV